jgi:hypothetical protein
VQIYLLAGRGDRDGQGIAAAVGHALLSDMRLPPPTNRIDSDRVVSSKIDRAAAPKIAMQRAGLDGVRAKQPAARFAVGFDLILSLAGVDAVAESGTGFVPFFHIEAQPKRALGVWPRRRPASQVGFDEIGERDLHHD